jgi:hypothetical protein
VGLPAYPFIAGLILTWDAAPAPRVTVSRSGDPGPTTGIAVVFGIKPGMLDITPPAPPAPEA